MPTPVVLCRMYMLRLPDAGDALEAQVAEAGGAVDWEGCLNACTDCGRRIVAKIEGARVVADSPDELVAQVRTLLVG